MTSCSLFRGAARGMHTCPFRSRTLRVVPNGRTLKWRCQGSDVDLARTKALTSTHRCAGVNKSIYINSQMSEVIFMSKKWHLGVREGGLGRKGGRQRTCPGGPASKSAEAGSGTKGPQPGFQGRDTAAPSGQLRPDQCLPGPPGRPQAGAEGGISIAIVLGRKTRSNSDYQSL